MKLWDLRSENCQTLETPSPVTSVENLSEWCMKSYNMHCNVESASLDPKGCNKGYHGPVHCLQFSPGQESYASG
ncbi:unnamed protein product [Thlaspi arvense]|uniref:Uncharacterized protein n=1 Tax=Thlaspi arvense TaxID=13288 RepID=A0AAU9RG98_THLAR|nr:unnamed protein product [Thlaspi arvense]